mmetsp:Transcript_382/g.852  ORF Transcript_382/g.852 Transcript_382/m.852 type:complete len:208 (-) Transcript_382:159-782(-)
MMPAAKSPSGPSTCSTPPCAGLSSQERSLDGGCCAQSRTAHSLLPTGRFSGGKSRDFLTTALRVLTPKLSSGWCGACMLPATVGFPGDNEMEEGVEVAARTRSKSSIRISARARAARSCCTSSVPDTPFTFAGGDKELRSSCKPRADAAWLISRSAWTASFAAASSLVSCCILASASVVSGTRPGTVPSGACSRSAATCAANFSDSS